MVVGDSFLANLWYMRSTVSVELDPLFFKESAVISASDFEEVGFRFVMVKYSLSLNGRLDLFV